MARIRKVISRLSAVSPKKSEVKVSFDTVGDLLDELAELATDPELQEVMSAQVEGPGGETFDTFTITRKSLSDGSEVWDFELTEERE